MLRKKFSCAIWLPATGVFIAGRSDWRKIPGGDHPPPPGSLMCSGGKLQVIFSDHRPVAVAKAFGDPPVHFGSNGRNSGQVPVAGLSLFHHQPRILARHAQLPGGMIEVRLENALEPGRRNGSRISLSEYSY